MMILVGMRRRGNRNNVLFCTKPAASVQYAEDFGRWLEDERTSVYEFVSLLETL